MMPPWLLPSKNRRRVSITLRPFFWNQRRKYGKVLDADREADAVRFSLHDGD